LEGGQGIRVSEGSALGALYRAQAPASWRALLAFSGERDVADDAHDEAFAQALARGEGIRDPLRWIWRVPSAWRRASSRTAGRAGELVGAGPAEGSPEPLLHVFAALQRLSPNQRLAVVLHDYADGPVSERVRRRVGSRTSRREAHPFDPRMVPCGTPGCRADGREGDSEKRHEKAGHGVRTD
jgi:hypothetical protein